MIGESPLTTNQSPLTGSKVDRTFDHLLMNEEKQAEEGQDKQEEEQDEKRGGETGQALSPACASGKVIQLPTPNVVEHSLPGEAVEETPESKASASDAPAEEAATDDAETKGPSDLDLFAQSLDALIVQQTEQLRASFRIAPYVTAYTVVLNWAELLDELVAKAIRGIQIACKAGCASCCYQMTGAPTIYTMAAYHHLSAQMNGAHRGRIYSDLNKFAKKSDKFMAKMGYEGGVSTDVQNTDKIRMESNMYWQEQIRCPFLAKKTDMCLIYPVRPPACRLHFVAGDSTACKTLDNVEYVKMPPIVYKAAYAPGAIYRQATGYGQVYRPFQRAVWALVNKEKGKKTL